MVNQLQSLPHDTRSVHDVDRHVSQPCGIFENAKKKHLRNLDSQMSCDARIRTSSAVSHIRG